MIDLLSCRRRFHVRSSADDNWEVSIEKPLPSLILSELHAHLARFRIATDGARQTITAIERTQPRLLGHGLLEGMGNTCKSDAEQFDSIGQRFVDFFRPLCGARYFQTGLKPPQPARGRN